MNKIFLNLPDDILKKIYFMKLEEYLIKKEKQVKKNKENLLEDLLYNGGLSPAEIVYLNTLEYIDDSDDEDMYNLSWGRW